MTGEISRAMADVRDVEVELLRIGEGQCRLGTNWFKTLLFALFQCASEDFERE